MTVENDEKLLLSKENDLTAIIVKSDSVCVNGNKIVETGVYWYRWYILILYSCSSALSSIAWNSWGPIESTVHVVFGWNTGTISLLSDWGAIIFLLFVFPSSYILDVFGLRKAIVVSSFCLLIGTGLRCITSEPVNATYLIHTAQIIIGFAGPVGQAAATVLSSTWFPSKQRTTATAIGSLSCLFGTALSFFIGPHIVQDFDSFGIKKSDKAYEALVSKLSDQVMRFMYVQFGMCSGIFLLVILTFPHKPPKPPSFTSNIERVHFLRGLKNLFKNPNFQLIAFAYGLTTGVYSAWCSDLALNLKEFSIDDETASWLGFWSLVAGAISGVALSIMADLLGALKLLVIMMFIVSTASFGVFGLICVEVIPKSITLLYFTSIIGGICINGTIPLFFELAVESSYPVAEGINTGAMTFSNNIYCFLFLSLPLIPGVGTKWMNWFLVISCAFCIPIMIVFKEKYKRLQIDISEKFRSIDVG
ncbi:solute carrier family 49 member 4 isoform X5 [Hydra vulgaris]|uniref:Solute carrier family 49 member 4 isoform X5 n=1 Tax=Hydra vulgaris TaxID=6087 RepID=A0ABM4BFG3_HYDVU